MDAVGGEGFGSRSAIITSTHAKISKMFVSVIANIMSLPFNSMAYSLQLTLDKVGNVCIMVTTAYSQLRAKELAAELREMAEEVRAALEWLSKENTK